MDFELIKSENLSSNRNLRMAVTWNRGSDKKWRLDDQHRVGTLNRFHKTDRKQSFPVSDASLAPVLIDYADKPHTNHNTLYTVKTIIITPTAKVNHNHEPF